jgi:hypothetical protein
MSEPQGDRFDSWKEIAAHLKRDLRTVRRWEAERGLPVHRVPGAGRRAVFAYRNEIDTWLRDSSSSASGDPQKGRYDRQARPGGWFLSLTVVGLAFVVSCLIISVWWTGKHLRGPVEMKGAALPSAEDKMRAPLTEPEIVSVTGILPRAHQTIVIKGRTFGHHVPFANMDTPFLAIRDETAHWAAGRIIDRNVDDVTLSISSWTDTEIVVTGLSGAYGQNGWELKPGDEISVAVWNPQTGAGPAIYRLICGRP